MKIFLPTKKFFQNISLILLIPILSLTVSSCAQGQKGGQKAKLKTICIVDRNGMSETVSNEERLEQYKTVNFFTPQPYQKVLRIYSRDDKGDIKAYVHSYHENGQPKQYLEVVNSRANGIYREWHPNGSLKLQVCVIGGEADLNPAAENTWLFDGHAKVWNEEGTAIAEICYAKGVLEGDSLYFHDNGAVWRKLPYLAGELHGTAEIFLSDGSLFQITSYEKGLRQGISQRFWAKNELAADEEFHRDALIFGRYYDINGALVSEIRDGTGYRAVFGKRELSELQQYKQGF